MAQYKPGTVSLVNGSDTIHFGEGVSLISDGLQAALASGVPLSFKRKGESATYQITNVLTEVSAQISPSYAGATATAVEYQIQRDFTHRGYPEINGTDADWPYQVTVAHRKISDDVQDIVGKTAYARLTSAYGLDINGPGTYDLSQNTTITDDVQGVDGVVINPGSYTLTFQGELHRPSGPAVHRTRGGFEVCLSRVVRGRWNYRRRTRLRHGRCLVAGHGRHHRLHLPLQLQVRHHLGAHPYGPDNREGQVRVDHVLRGR